MLFQFLNFSQRVVCMFGHKKIYKVTNLKVHSKGRYFVLKKTFSRTTTNGSFGLQSGFPVWGVGVGWGGNAWLSTACFQNQYPVRVFYITYISDGNRLFSENCGCHFHLILHVMSDKAAFVSGALLCVQSYRLQHRLPLAEN